MRAAHIGIASRAVAAAVIGVLASTPLSAQSQASERFGAVRIVVRDATALPVPDAEVALRGSDGSAAHARTDSRGEVAFERLPPSMYTGSVEAAGFAPHVIEPFQLLAGARQGREIVLQVGFAEQLNVTPEAIEEPLNAFTRKFTEEQLAALPEDPEDLALVLRQLVGDDAEIRVDGFSGGRLPIASRIREIRVRSDVGASSSGGGARVEILTTPGGDRWRNNLDASVRDEALAARNAFSGQRPAGQTRHYSWSLDGPLARERTAFSANIDASRSMENQLIRAALLDGLYSNLIEQPSDEVTFWMRIEHVMTPTQSVRVDFTRTASRGSNQGIGELDLPERAFTSHASNGELRIGHHATLSRRSVNDLRVTLGWDSADVSSNSHEQTIRVLDAFTGGGAQQQGGRRSLTLRLENELEFSVARHRMTVGVNVDGSSFHGDEISNLGGTYTFDSLAAFKARQPATFTQRVGDPNYRYSMLRLGWQMQDDYRPRRNLVINLGLRQDVQSYLRDWMNFSPRFGVNWTPFPKARTALRAGLAVTHSLLPAAAYGQTVLVNGRQQWDVVVSNPGYLDPWSAGVADAVPPPSIIRARPDLVMPFTRRYSVGLEQPIGRFFRFRATGLHQTGHHLFRSRDANAPVLGVRPDPSVLTITELESTARSLSDSLQTELSISYPRSRLSANVAYTLGKSMDDTDGLFSLPPDSFNLAGEWGPSRSDVRHRLNASIMSDLPGGFRVTGGFRAQSGVPYTITTGADANGDGVHNERPAGVGRNSARGDATKNLDLTLAWQVNLGHRGNQRGVGSSNQSGGPAAERPTARSRDAGLVRLELFVRTYNVFNFVNLQNFSGVLTSPFFGLPTAAGPARRVVVGTRAWF